MTPIDVIFFQVGTMRRKCAGKGLGLYQSKKKKESVYKEMYETNKSRMQY